MAMFPMTLGDPKKRGPDRSYSNKSLSFGAKIAIFGPVNPEIICLHFKKEKLTQTKYIPGWQVCRAGYINKQLT